MNFVVARTLFWRHFANWMAFSLNVESDYQIVENFGNWYHEIETIRGKDVGVTEKTQNNKRFYHGKTFYAFT